MTGATAEWVSRMRDASCIDLVPALGLAEIGRTPLAWCIGPCPACGGERRHTRSHDRRGAIGVPKATPGGWHCWQCGATGDTIDLAAYVLYGRRYRALSATARAGVREWCMRWLGLSDSHSATAPSLRTPRASAPKPAEVPSYPPAEELRALWRACVRVDDDGDVAAYLRGRGIDPTGVAELDVARALPASAALPQWARMGSQPWTRTGHLLLVLLRDARGAAQSVIARSIEPGVDPARKSIAPRGHTRARLVMACPLGVLMLRHGTHPSAWPAGRDGVAWWPSTLQLEVLVSEGEPDFLTSCTEWSDAAEHPPATLGVIQGAWSQEIADRIPDGSKVVLDQHHDPSGDEYARRAYETLKHRPIDVRRSRPAGRPEVAS